MSEKSGNQTGLGCGADDSSVDGNGGQGNAADTAALSELVTGRWEPAVQATASSDHRASTPFAVDNSLTSKSGSGLAPGRGRRSREIEQLSERPFRTVPGGAASGLRSAASLKNNRGVKLANDGRVRLAMAAFHAAVALNTRLVEAHHNLVLGYALQGRWEAASQVCQKAINVNPGSKELVELLHWLQTQQGLMRRPAAAAQTSPMSPGDKLAAMGSGSVFIRSPSRSKVQAIAHFDAAVVMPTMLRPTIINAARSVFAQEGIESVQILIGVDKAIGDYGILEEIMHQAPEHCAVSVIDLGYSTSVRHGGFHAARDGGALRTILSYAAKSRYVAYLDDDNWWAKDHLASLREAIQGFEWAYSKRWFVDPDRLIPLAVDDWESVGPGGGIFKERFGGFVDPNTLMVDKVACEAVLPLWCVPLRGDSSGLTADRSVFNFLRNQRKGNATNQPTSFYKMNPTDPLHPQRLQTMSKLGGVKA